MAGSPYASALGRLKVEFSGFLSKDALGSYVAARDVGEFLKLLEASPYAPELNAARAAYQGIALAEIALNRTLVRRNQLAWAATPFAGRPAVAAYLRRWDLQNIELILAEKAKGGAVTEVEAHLVSSREIPAGIIGGTMTLDDFRILYDQPSVEAIATALVKYGYGQTILPLLDTYARSRDIFPLVLALQRAYYRDALEAARFFQGDEWVIREFLHEEIDAGNALVLLKGKDAGLPYEPVAEHLVEGGALTGAAVEDLYSSATVPALATRLVTRYPSIAEGNDAFAARRSLAGYDSAIRRDRAIATARRMRTYPLSLAIVFTYLLFAEFEWSDLRRIVYGRLYGIPSAEVEPLLVSPRL